MKKRCAVYHTLLNETYEKKVWELPDSVSATCEPLININN